MDAVSTMDLRWAAPASLGGLAVALLAALVVGALFYGLARSNRVLVATVAGGLSFQLVHVLEHAVQATAWLGRPGEPAYLTPWAAAARNGLAFWCQLWPGKGVGPARGAELLHLAGNVIFLVGVVGMTMLARKVGSGRSLRACRRALVLQGLHVAEHVALTATLFVTGSPLGISTFFGTIGTTSSLAVGYRVWWHFAVNLAATVLAVQAARRLRAAGAFELRSLAAGPYRPARALGDVLPTN